MKRQEAFEIQPLAGLTFVVHRGLLRALLVFGFRTMRLFLAFIRLGFRLLMLVSVFICLSHGRKSSYVS